MIVTIDGPAGAGKSSVARRLAARLGFRFLDTGAMYRAVVLAARDAGLAWTETEALERLTEALVFEFRDDQVWLNGRDVTDEIRAQEVSAAIHHVADNPRIREHLVSLQRRIAGSGNVVTEGRDQGTVAFPDARCKFFLTAEPEERARRRFAQLKSSGRADSLDEVLRQQQQRDERDAVRPVGGLRQADDAIVVATDDLSCEQVVDRLEHIARAILEQGQREQGH
jgi:cytidylate kinase